MDAAEFSALGPLTARVGGEPVELGGRKQRAVLARLLTAAGAVVSADRLVADLWPGEPSRRALGGLQAYVSNLRRVLEPGRARYTAARLLVSQPPGYALRVPLERVDVRRFEAGVREGTAFVEQGNPQRAAAVLDRALALWRGTPYEDLDGEDWLVPEVARLTELRLVGREQWAAGMLALGRPTAVVTELEAAAVEAPLREELWRLLALARYRCGRQADALAALRQLRARLADELGVDPTPAVQAMEAALLAHDPDLHAVPAQARATPVPEEALPPPASEEPTPVAPTFVGREIPLARLRAAAVAARSEDRAQVVVVGGEAGIGKTALVEAFAAECARSGWRVGWGHALAGGGAPPLWPWRRLLDELTGGDLPESLHPLAGDAPREGSTALTVDAAQARFALHAAVADLVAQIGRTQPTVIVLDDLQWADAASLRLLADLPGLLPPCPIVLMATLRTDEAPSEADGVLLDALATLAHHGGTRLTLDGLDPDGVALLSAAALHGIPGHEHIAGLLAARTGGNPFFIRELLRLMTACGVNAVSDDIPEAVADVLHRRLARLPDATRRMLAVAAVAGQTTDVDLLVSASGMDADEAWDALDAGVVAGLLVEAGSGLVLAHDLLRTLLYAELPPLARARLHSRLGAAIELRGAAEPAELAEHYCRAGAAAAGHAVRYASAAARDAADRLAHDAAAAWWGRAIQSYRHAGGDPRGLVELLLARVSAQLDAGDTIGATATRTEALHAADAVDDAALTARALTAVEATVLRKRAFNEVDAGVVDRIEDVLRRLPDGNDPLRVRLLATLGQECYDAGADPRCDSASAAAVDIARRLGDPRLLAVALGARYGAIRRPATADALAAVGAELVGLDAAHRLPASGVAGRIMLVSVHTQRFELDAADRLAAECDALLRRLRLPALTIVHESWRAARLALDGRFAEAEDAYRAGAEHQRRLGQADVELWFACVRAVLWFQQGRYAEAAALVRDAGAVAWLGHDLAVLAGAPAGPWPPLPDDFTLLTAAAVRAEAALAAGARDVQAAAYSRLAPSAGQLTMGGSSFLPGPVDLYLGRLARALGDQAAAARHLDDAAADCAAAGLEWWAQEVSKTARRASSP